MPWSPAPVAVWACALWLAAACAGPELEDPPSKQSSASTTDGVANAGMGGTRAGASSSGKGAAGGGAKTASGTTSNGGSRAGHEQTESGQAGDTAEPETEPPAGGSAGTDSSAGGTPPIESPCGTKARTSPQAGAAGAPGAVEGGDAAGAGGTIAGDTTVFFEDFENGDARWEQSEQTDWSVVVDEVTGSSVYKNEDVVNQPAVAFVRDACFTDVVVRARVKILDFPSSSTTAIAGPCVHVESDKDYYVIGPQGNGNFGVLRVSGSSRSSIKSSNEVRVVENTWYEVRVEVLGNDLTGFLDDEQIVSASDQAHIFGSIGVCTANAEAEFDDVQVTLP